MAPIRPAIQPSDRAVVISVRPNEMGNVIIKIVTANDFIKILAKTIGFKRTFPLFFLLKFVFD